jgi:hypothetical protein
MKRETISQFQGRENVTKITSDNGQVSYLTQSSSLANTANAVGADDYAVFESEKKHVFFLFQGQVEKAKFYLGQKLQGLSSAALEAKMAEGKLVTFESFNANTNQWVPCIGLAENQQTLNRRKLVFG